MIYTLKKNDKLFVKILLKAEPVSEKKAKCNRKNKNIFTKMKKKVGTFHFVRYNGRIEKRYLYQILVLDDVP